MTAERYATTTPEEREAAIEAAALCAQRGGLVVIPTDTVYGIGADAFDPDAVALLLNAKGRGRDMPPPVLVSTASTLDALASDVPAWVHTLTEAFWPGALTLVCREQSSLQWDLGDTRGTVAVRMPDHELTREILDRTGPLAVSSANLTGSPAATDAEAAIEMLGADVDVVVDDGVSPGGEASTIVDATSGSARLLRVGALAPEEIAVVLAEVDEVLTDADGEVVDVEGFVSSRPERAASTGDATGPDLVKRTPTAPAVPAGTPEDVAAESPSDVEAGVALPSVSERIAAAKLRASRAAGNEPELEPGSDPGPAPDAEARPSVAERIAAAKRAAAERAGQQSGEPA